MSRVCHGQASAGGKRNPLPPPLSLPNGGGGAAAGRAAAGGAAGPCATFASPALVDSDGGRFECLRLEVWAVGGTAADAAAARRRRHEQRASLAALAD